MRKDIQALNKKIDELSATYNRKLRLSRNTKEEVEVHSVAQDSTADHQAPNPAIDDMWNKLIQPFLEAQRDSTTITIMAKRPKPAILPLGYSTNVGARGIPAMKVSAQTI